MRENHSRFIRREGVFPQSFGGIPDRETFLIFGAADFRAENKTPNPRSRCSRPQSMAVRNRPGISSRFDHWEGIGFAPDGAEVHSQGRSPWENVPRIKIPPRRGGGSSPVGLIPGAATHRCERRRSPPLAIDLSPSGAYEVGKLFPACSLQRTELTRQRVCMA